MAIIEEDETLLAFTEESLEHLDGIEADLLTIEEDGADIDSDVVNKVFRAVHSIKGGAGFLGLENIKDLSHYSENLLNMVRNNELVPTPAIVSVLLDATDKLTSLINDVTSSNEVDISTELNALKNAVKNSLPEEEKESLDTSVEVGTQAHISLFAVSEFDITSCRKGGNNIFILEYDLLTDIEQQGRTPLDVISELQQTGQLLDSMVNTASIGNLGADPDSFTIPFYVLFATIMEKELLMAFLGLPEQKITFIEPDQQDAPPPEQQAPASIEVAAPEPPPAPASPPVAATPPPKKPAPPKPFKAESNLRVNVKILDNLMTLAGELVLTRNQLSQAVLSDNSQGVDAVSQRLDMVTTELQEAIMSTRMQPVGNVFHKFKRVVRDLSRDLGKQIELVIEGEDVELDKTIIEAIGDPLTHLVRNSIDHGIEMPDVRLANQKEAAGTLRLSAFHEGGQVIIEIADNGAGIDTERLKEKSLSSGTHDKAELEAMSTKELAKLIFTPGLSTAQEVSDISGRGVGMDVVHTNLSTLGGIIDITTALGTGTTITIKLPLTLAIIPSLIISVQDERYAIPQVNLVELVRIPANQTHQRIERIGDAMVMRLRGELLPLVFLTDALGIEQRTFVDPTSQDVQLDRRHNLADRRGEELDQEEQENPERRARKDRRTSPLSAYNILVLSSGDHNYGLIVDHLLDSEEIVVKPLGSHLRHCKGYAGATIQGDGKIALILDVVGLSSLMNLTTVAEHVKAHSQRHIEENDRGEDSQTLLIVKNSEEEQMAVPLGLISRIERIKSTNIEITGGRKNIQYRGGSLPLFGVDEVANIAYRDEAQESCYVIVFPICGREVGILFNEIVDIIDIKTKVDDITHRQPGILGSMIIFDHITLFIDLYGVVSTLMPEWALEQSISVGEEGESATILVVEDSKFFLSQITSFLQDVGFQTLEAEDGVEALDILAREHVDMVITDIEMPNMDGLELSRHIRADSEIAHLPIIAVTSVAGKAAELAGKEAGVDDYLIKLDREMIIERVNHYLGKQ